MEFENKIKKALKVCIPDNGFVKYFLENPDKPWKYELLSDNPNITWEIVDANLDKPWDFNELSSNKIVTWEIVNKYPHLKWNYEYLSVNPNITWEIIKDNLDKPWNFKWFLSNINVTWDIFKNNPIISLKIEQAEYIDILGDINNLCLWSYFWLSRNPNITNDIIRENIHENWDFKYLSKRKDIEWDIVKSRLHAGWDFKQLALSPTITFDMIKSTYDYEHWKDHFVIDKVKWHSAYISANPNITWDIVKNNPDFYWRFEILAKNLNISLNIIQKHLNLKKAYFDVYLALSTRTDITWNFIKQNPSKHWDFDYLFGKNTSITYDDYIENLDFFNKYNLFDLTNESSIYFSISKNRNLTFDIIRNNPDKPWNFRMLSHNKMDQPALKKAVERQMKRTLEIKEELMMKTYLIM